MNKLATYEFRPVSGYFKGPFRRYAEGQWIPDDGEYDLAFVSDGYGAPLCLYVSTWHRENLLCSWLTTPGRWGAYEPKHPGGNAWHYALKDGTKNWGEGSHNESSPNYIAGHSGMDWLCKKHRCANGDYVDWKADDPHIVGGLVRDRDTKEVFRFPEGLKCMYCEATPRPAPVPECAP